MKTLTTEELKRARSRVVDEVRDLEWSQARNQVDNKARGQVENQVLSRAGRRVVNLVCDQTWLQVLIQINAKIVIIHNLNEKFKAK